MAKEELASGSRRPSMNLIDEEGMISQGLY